MPEVILLLFIFFFIIIFYKNLSPNIALSIISGFFLRLFLILSSQNIQNYDLNSWILVGKATSIGKSIYPEISSLHYPYLPSVLYLLGLFYKLNGLINTIFLIKLTIVIFDSLNIYLVYLLSNKNKNSAFLYAINPVTTSVSAFHGQFCPIVVFFLMLSAILLNKGKNLASFSMLSISITIKPWALLFTIPFIRHSKNIFHILIIGLIPFFSIIVYSLFFNASFNDILTPIFSYSSLTGIWGFTKIIYFIHPIHNKIIIRLMTYVFLITLFYFQLKTKRRRIEKEITASIFFFFVFSPSFAIQYTSWIIPFLIAIKPKYWLIAIIALSLYITSSYLTWVNNESSMIFNFLKNLESAISYISWLISALILYTNIKQHQQKTLQDV